MGEGDGRGGLSGGGEGRWGVLRECIEMVIKSGQERGLRGCIVRVW